MITSPLCYAALLLIEHFAYFDYVFFLYHLLQSGKDDSSSGDEEKINLGPSERPALVYYDSLYTGVNFFTQTHTHMHTQKYFGSSVF